MSKRNSNPVASNTLFNYFTKTPSNKKTKLNGDADTGSSTKNSISTENKIESKCL